jgi:hypothetical protein
LEMGSFRPIPIGVIQPRAFLVRESGGGEGTNAK